MDMHPHLKFVCRLWTEITSSQRMDCKVFAPHPVLITDQGNDCLSACNKKSCLTSMRTCRQAPHGPTKRSLMSLHRREEERMSMCVIWSVSRAAIAPSLTMSQRWPWTGGGLPPRLSGWPSAQHTPSDRRRRSPRYSLSRHGRREKYSHPFKTDFFSRF